MALPVQPPDQAGGIAFVFQGGGSLAAPPSTPAISPVDFRGTARLIGEGYRLAGVI
jgi:hypothetical protein